MKNRKVLNHQVTAGGQPSGDDLVYLKQHQFRSVVNLRTEGEADQTLSPDEERRLVEGLGMAYLHVPVSAQTISPELLGQFVAEFDDLPKPAYVHCESGPRAGLFAMLWLGVNQGLTGEQAIARGREYGFSLDNPQLVEPVRRFLDSQERVQ
ncbi:MAG TPA: protein tyrosine phosphatase family protein [Candidatus Sumerlaeota bacterium]|nr:protein tyrosine phosphatase family protein [Candidatus Sumerlaeota bacterium]HOR27248.1 protein tyrosine phosphatase family protein [Candidatus Sumerlaeota bacterium]HPK01804.1 protein tyrosine phosphatase family protein [Candidatus Sumerlaeota bacterium]